MVDEDTYAKLLEVVDGKVSLLQKLKKFSVTQSFSNETRSYVRDCCMLTPGFVESSPKLKQWLGDEDEIESTGRQA